VLRIYVSHYNEHRPHSLDQQAPTFSVPVQLYAIFDPSQVRRHDRLGGLIHGYGIAG
jgi:hypothetical protein